MRRVYLAVAAALLAMPITSAWAAGDAARGALTFSARCALCHSAVKGGPNKIGPNLFGVMGRKAASATGYSFSQAMQKSGIVWTSAAIRTYLANPARTVPGGKMAFAGVGDRAVLDDLVSYLGSLY